MFNNLPVSADSLTANFLNINVNQPPFVPQLELPPSMANYGAYISGCFALEVQNKAQTNNMRVFMFNLCANNNWQNVEFAENVQAAVDFILLMLVKKQFGDVQTAIANCIPRIVEMITAANCATYPGLANHVTDPTAQQSVKQLIQQFQNVGQEINKMKQMVANNNVPRGTANYTAATSGRGAPQATLFSGQSQADQPGFRAAGQRGNRWARGTEEVSMEPQHQQRPGVQPQPKAQTRTDHLASPFQSRRPGEKDITSKVTQVMDFVPGELVNHEFLTTDAATRSYMIPAQDSVAVWVPTVNQPYTPAFNPKTHSIFHQVFEDGRVNIVIQETPAAMMDWDEHNLEGVTFGTRSRVQSRVDNSKVWAGVQTLNHADMDVSKDVPEGVDATEPEISVHLNNIWANHASLDSLLVDVRLSYLSACVAAKEDLLAYEAYGSVWSVSVDREDHSAAVAKLAAITEYKVLAQKLKGIKGDITEVLWYTIDDLLTKAVNRVLQQSLSLDLSMDRFSDDIDEVLVIVGSKGPMLLEAFLKYQTEVIARTLGVISDPDREQMAESLDLAAHPELRATYVGTNYSVTVLDCMSHDLEIELVDGLGAALISSLTKEMHDLVKGIFDRADEFDSEFSRHLIITNDLKILEASRGHVGVDFYNLTLVG